ncbi:MAG TPA: Gfo/Idh/MocA family oxidoreductase [Opitutus sp.]|nr:Gfo/Idh/MocA family oxidoreductase [Opitutus sp.]
MTSPAPLTRRQFVGQLSLAAVAALALPRSVRAAEDGVSGGKKLGVALLGLGSYAQHQLAPALRETKHCRLAGIITGTPGKIERWQKRFGVPARSAYRYEDMERVAEDPDIDIVYVVTPPGTHREFVVRAAAAGKHVICEKPMAPTVRECDEMIAACREAGRKLSIGYRLEFEPRHIEMERLARDPAFGPFTKMRGGFGFRAGDGRGWRLDKKLAGGGPLPDVGIYVIQAACRAAGDRAPIAVTAREEPKTRPALFTDVEEAIRWTMEFPGGAVCEGFSSYNDDVNEFRAESRDGRNWVELGPAYSYGGLEGRTSRGPMAMPDINQQAAQMDDFARCILEKRDTPVSGAMGRRDIAIMEAIYASAAAGGKRVEVRA